MTKKKTSKKKAPAKRVRQSAKYQLAGELSDTKSPQQLLIRDAMKKLGPATAAEIAGQVKGKLTTKQTPERVVSFYLAAWKKIGTVKSVA
ncbi:MAG TPA: hypothetical protein VK763_05750 [Terriglobales bacterium]|jgi:hypothetical protein|nr:hypothetical protein [Terriglobales bacterium]